MSEQRDVIGRMINREQLPEYFPTHKHSVEFWEQLGRTVATFGFLEEMLGKAIFALTATKKYSPEEIDQAYANWLPKLEKALTDQLYKLAESYHNAIKESQSSEVEMENASELVDKIKKASRLRNVLCHGSWRPPDNDGKSIPFFATRNIEVFDTAIDINFLRQVQTHVAELACLVVSSVTLRGWQFPGSGGPGRRIM